jgi:rhodanese-related sulfurtransferase
VTGPSPSPARAPQANPAPSLDARGLPLGYTFKPDWEVTPRDAANALQQPEAVRPLLVDCRRDDEWAFNRITGAVHMPLADLERRADELADDQGHKTRPIIVQCHHGARSLRAAAALRALGFSDVKSLAGGIELWSLTIDPTVPRY